MPINLKTESRNLLTMLLKKDKTATVSGALRRGVIPAKPRLDFVLDSKYFSKESCCAIMEEYCKEHNYPAPQHVRFMPCAFLVTDSRAITSTSFEVHFHIALTEKYGAALMFSTGNALFNRIFCARALVLGYKFSRGGLIHGEEIVAGRTENQIFGALGVEVLLPVDRNFRAGSRLTILNEMVEKENMYEEHQKPRRTWQEQNEHDKRVSVRRGTARESSRKNREGDA